MQYSPSPALAKNGESADVHSPIGCDTEKDAKAKANIYYKNITIEELMR
jgi:hypothetical protein